MRNSELEQQEVLLAKAARAKKYREQAKAKNKGRNGKIPSFPKGDKKKKPKNSKKQTVLNSSDEEDHNSISDESDDNGSTNEKDNRNDDSTSD